MTVHERCQKQMLNEFEIVMKENTCPFIVQFYGALFKEDDCWICMELMDTSLDRFYKYVYHKLHQSISESVRSTTPASMCSFTLFINRSVHVTY